MIRNFGKINANFYRGAQPREREYAELTAMGIKSVIDLCDDHDRKDYANGEATGAGLWYVPFPMSDRDYPAERIAPNFLRIITGTNRGHTPMFLHCAGGRHRTGALTAIYRMKVDNWTLKEAMDELESYFGFWGSARWWGHREIERFIENYWYYLHPEEIPQ